MIMTQEARWKFRCTLRWLRNLLGWILLILFFMSLGWLIVYLIESAPHEKRVERRALPFFPKLSYHVLGGEVQVNLSSGKPIMP